MSFEGIGFPSVIVAAIAAWLVGAVIAFVLAAFMRNLGVAGIGTGLAVGFLAWLGFVVTSMVVNHSFAGVRPMLTVIDAGHWLAVLLVQGAVLGWFHS